MNLLPTIPPVIIQDDPDLVGIPLLFSERYVWIEWTAEQSWQDFLIKSATIFYDSVEIKGFDYLCVYSIVCCMSDVRYFLVTRRNVEDVSDIEDAFCVPLNAFNLDIVYGIFKETIKERVSDD